MFVYSTHNALCAYGFHLVVISVNDNNYKRSKLDVQRIKCFHIYEIVNDFLFLSLQKNKQRTNFPHVESTRTHTCLTFFVLCMWFARDGLGLCGGLAQ